MSIYKINKSIYLQYIKSQRDEVIKDFDMDEEGNLCIEYNHKGYKCSDIKKTRNSKIKAISLFSGCGGLDIGTLMAGVKIISTLDNFDDSVQTMKLNKIFGRITHNNENINNISGSFYKEILNKENPEKLLIIGGPPCQPFSKAGYWVTNKKRDSKNDERNLFVPYFELIKDIKPNGFLIENVESIMHPSNKETVDLIFETIGKLGYKLSLLKINAAEFGIPQKRKRVFFLASKKSIDAKIIKTHGNEKECELNKKLKPYSRVIDWIGKFDSSDKYVNDELSIEGKWENELKKVPFGKNYIALTERAGYPNPVFRAQSRYWLSLLKLHPLLPSWTILAGPGHWEGPFHWNNRRLSCRELAAIQTFPDDYEFYGSSASVHKQIGNAVPPLLGQIIVKELCKWV